MTASQSTASGSLDESKFRSQLRPIDWLASVSFSEGFRRSFFLFSQQFRNLVLIYFLGGVIISLLLYPLNLFMIGVSNQLLFFFMTPPTDLIQISVLALQFLGILLLQQFLITLTAFVLSSYAVFWVIRRTPSLQILSNRETPVHFPVIKVLSAGLIVAILITSVNLIIVPIPFLYVLVFFTAPLLILTDYSSIRAIQQSIKMRFGHWRRLFSAFLVTVLFAFFAGTLGGTIYQNVSAVLLFFGVPIDFIAPVLQALIIQLPVAMVAPLLPMFSLVFYSSGLTAYETHRHRKYLRRVRRRQRHQVQALIPKPIEISAPVMCSECGTQLQIKAAFCHRCGAAKPKSQNTR